MKPEIAKPDPSADRPRRPTMREVAALAGVSLTTVSRALNGDPTVRPDLAERVREAVRLLGYRRDLMATNLRRADRQSAIVGVVCDDVSNPFPSALLRAVEHAVSVRGMLTIVGSSEEDPKREREIVEAFLDRRADGLIVVPTGSDQSYLRNDMDAGVPVVFVDRPPRFIDADAVVSDNAGGMRALTEHLLDHGHRRIGYLGDRQEIYTASERLRGHSDALAARGIQLDPRLLRLGLYASDQAAAATAELMSGPQPPTALISAQNLLSIGVIDTLMAMDLWGRTAVGGFDDIVLANALRPGLTVVAQAPETLGQTTAERLLARLDGDRAETRTIVVQTRLIARGSAELQPRHDATH